MPQLIEEHRPDRPVAAVLVLHGGGSRGRDVPVSPTQLSVLRMIPIAQRLAWAGRGQLAVYRLLNSVRGWHSTRTPVTDVRWALAELADRFSADLPVGLVGHSLGGRAALLAGGEGSVRSVVALAPWLYASDVNPALAGRRVLIVHGDQDRIASPDKAAAVARALEPITQVTYIAVRGGKHAMLRRNRVFDGLATDFLMATLLERAPVGGPLAEAWGGTHWLQV